MAPQDALAMGSDPDRAHRSHVNAPTWVRPPIDIKGGVPLAV